MRLAVTIAALAVLHFAETLIWAVPLYVRDIIPSLRDSYYYVLESYTTLGEGNVTLPDRWRLLGPIIGMSGLFTFGWTGSVLVSIMKIDRSLVWALDEGANGADVLRATISLATALRIPVTAEGIETTRQAAILRDAGCDQLQGYLIGKPMSAYDISSKLEEESAA